MQKSFSNIIGNLNTLLGIAYYLKLFEIEPEYLKSLNAFYFLLKAIMYAKKYAELLMET